MSSPRGAREDAAGSAPENAKDDGRPGVTKAPQMLRAAKDFAALQRSDRSRSDGLLSVRFVPNGLAETRFGISTGRRIGGAVVRNRLRRRIRTILRGLAQRLLPGCDVLIVTRPACASASQAELASTLERLLRRGGALRAEGTGR